jgi:membrane protease YdiL (CAAX protease family)
MQRFVLHVSIAGIAAYWTFLGIVGALTAPVDSVAAGVRDIALHTCAFAAVMTLVLDALMRGSGERLGDLGFGRRLGPPESTFTFPMRIFLVLIFGMLASVVAGAAGPAETEPSIFDDLAREPFGPFWLLVLSVVGGGYLEELIRAFCLTRFERVFGSAGLVAAVLVDSTVFGLGHRYQGNAAVVVTGMLGLCFAGIFLWRRRVVDAMVMHALWDVVGVLAISASARTG